MSMWYRQLIRLLFLSCIAFGYVYGAAARADEKKSHEVQDLAYGVSLFNYYQQKYFSAITSLLVAEHNKAIKEDENNPLILLGGLYLSYDLHNKSSKIFQKILETDGDKMSLPIQDQARFLLGKNQYRDGFYALAEEQFIKITTGLQRDNEEEKLFLLNAIFLFNDDFDQALKTLDYFSSSSPWKGYAQFNTASHLMQHTDKPSSELGFELMEELGLSSSKNAEKLILKDKANLALAYVALRDGQSKNSIEYFNKVRLNGVETNKALLGVGWARYRSNEFKAAVIPWMHLASSQTESDLAVQEAFISIPYAFEKMELKDQALHHYGLAVDSYKFQLDETQQLKSFIKSDEFIRQLNPGSLGKEATSAVKIIKNLDPLLTQYLLPFLSSVKFQYQAKHYLDLIHLRFTLNHWQNNIPALQMILKEKRKVYGSKLSKTMDDESINKAKKLTQQRDALVKQVEKIARSDDAVKLAKPKESTNLVLLKSIGKRLEKYKNSDDEELVEVRKKYKILQGRMQWNIDVDYPVRIWDLNKQLKSLNAAVESMNKSMVSLKDAWESAPEKFADFDKRIANKEGKVKKLIAKVNASIVAQEKKLRTMALEDLRLHRNQIKLYHDRALFAKARLYDSLMERK